MKKLNSTNQDTLRILAQDVTASNNTWLTGQNNNDLIIGPSGAGKTRGYVKPNILQCNESLIIADTKGNLMDQLGPVLREKGYRLYRIDLKDPDNSTCGYNPMDFVRFDRRRGCYKEQDIMLLGEVLVPTENALNDDPFWNNAAKMYVTSILAYILQCLPQEEHTLSTVPRMLAEMGTGRFYQLFDELARTDPDSYAVKLYRLFKSNSGAEKMETSIRGIAGERFASLLPSTLEDLYSRPDRIRFRDLGREKSALFLYISDTDRSMDRIASLVYTQAIHDLMDSADTEYPDQCLAVPVRFILDDFATNAYIPKFHDITSVIRSRGIAVSVILQSITQLDSLYGPNNAQTIVNNCDHWLYLGGQDLNTARLIARKADKREQSILNLPPHKAYVFSRGEPPVLAKGYDLSTHPLYDRLPEHMAARLPQESPELDSQPGLARTA